MELLDYEKLWNCLNISNTERLIKIIMYTKENDKYKIFSNSETSKHIEFLIFSDASIDLGSVYLSNEIIYVSLGKIVNDFTEMRINVKTAISFVHKLIVNKSQVIFEECEYTEDAIYAFVISSYKYDFLKKDKSDYLIKLVTDKYKNIIEIANFQNFARFLGDTPANHLTPSIFTKYAEKLFKNDSITFKVYDHTEISNMKMMLSVGHGSVENSKLLEIKYYGRGEEYGIDVAMVGKGVTFDSGGISLKPALNMASMKQDMMGAATLLSTLKLAVKFKIPLNITGTFPLVENMPGSKATKPGDVLISMNGLTVEVDNTDAEGRLILGDAFCFAQKNKPKYLIDAATLTGAMSISLGSVYGGFFSNDEDLSKIIYESGIETNDLLWRMPLSYFYSKSLKSDIADLNNMGGREAGAIKAAEFLHHFIENDVKWAHFDIAGLMDKSYNKSLYGKCATGRPIRAFIKLLDKLSNLIKN